MACKYKDALGCTDCDFVRFVLCSRFKEARIRECAASLGAFRYSFSGDVPVARVCYSHYPVKSVRSVQDLYSRKEYVTLSHRLKSMALWVALHEYSGLPVLYLSLDSIIEACFAYGRGEYSFVGGVYFLEVWECGVEKEKVVSFLNSVISKIESVGGRVFLLSSWVLPVIGVGWHRLSVGSSKKKGSVRSSQGAVVSPSSVVGSYMKEEEL